MYQNQVFFSLSGVRKIIPGSFHKPPSTFPFSTDSKKDSCNVKHMAHGLGEKHGRGGRATLAGQVGAERISLEGAALVTRDSH